MDAGLGAGCGAVLLPPIVCRGGRDLGRNDREQRPGVRALGQAVAELCRMAGADESLIPQWTAEGRRRAEAAQHPPFTGGAPSLHHRAAVRGSRFRLGPILLCRSRPQCRHGGEASGICHQRMYPFLGIWIGSMIADDNPLTHPADAVG
jgi:hypothetical protein